MIETSRPRTRLWFEANDGRYRNDYPKPGSRLVDFIDKILPVTRLRGTSEHRDPEWEAGVKDLVGEGQVFVVALTMGHLGAVPVLLPATVFNVDPRQAVN